jgi:hypothetical protein
MGKKTEVDGFAAGGKSGRPAPSPKGWKSVRDSDASAPLKKPVNNERGFGHTGRKGSDRG